jgi:phytoene dehydrogenase-like protein
LVANGITDFVIVEARDELGGRAHDIEFAGIRVENGCNWVSISDLFMCCNKKLFATFI